jgi:hypothetical protein
VGKVKTKSSKKGKKGKKLETESAIEKLETQIVAKRTRNERGRPWRSLILGGILVIAAVSLFVAHEMWSAIACAVLVFIAYATSVEAVADFIGWPKTKQIIEKEIEELEQQLYILKKEG